MKNLLYKEFKLTGATITYLFLAFTLMTFIPSYPILVSGFFVCMGIFYTFQFAREYNDTIYTALLPVKKQDVVKAKFLFTLTLEMIAFVLYTIFSCIRIFLLKDLGPYAVTTLMNPNIAFLGYILIAYSLFNYFFLKGFFQTGYYIGKPFVKFCISVFILVGVCETLHFLPPLHFLNDMSGNGLIMQFIVLLTGILIFLALTFISFKSSSKTFDKIDM